jgi:hypothetical protein
MEAEISDFEVIYNAYFKVIHKKHRKIEIRKTHRGKTCMTITNAWMPEEDFPRLEQFLAGKAQSFHWKDWKKRDESHRRTNILMFIPVVMAYFTVLYFVYR